MMLADRKFQQSIFGHVLVDIFGIFVHCRLRSSQRFILHVLRFAFMRQYIHKKLWSMKNLEILLTASEIGGG